MLLRIKPQSQPRPSEITPESVFQNRRLFLGQAAAAGVVPALAAFPGQGRAATPEGADTLDAARSPVYTADEKQLTSYEDASRYNNFYEFGTDKSDPSRNSGAFEPRPWSVEVKGEVKGAGIYNIEDLIKRYPLEERVYRLRCVEAWSMVIPWVGFPLGSWIRDLEPSGSAKYVEFVTVFNPEQMPGQRRPILDWPYVEALRLDEAMNPLTLLTFGMYGRLLPKQNGAPVRVVIPWKYGFKSIKSIVRIRFTEQQPATTWNVNAPREYGFYANVNPEVDHPRWSQAKERKIGRFFKHPTLMFNGYGEEVADLYQGMDLNIHY